MSEIDWTAVAVIAVPIVLGVWGVAYGYVKKRAADPIIDKYDKILTAMDAAAPLLAKVEEWSDPSSDSVPPSPRNPLGQSR